MIKFFRKIRYDLMEQNKTAKYFKYAIGEIVLVVIGILIALQINNWNESKKERSYENYILTEISANLAADIVQIEHILTQRRKTQKSLLRIKSYLKTENIIKDSLIYDIVQLYTFERYFSTNTAYEISKAKGLQISNESLRTQIANYYEHEQNKAHSSIQDIERAFLDEFLIGMKEFILDYNYGVSVTLKKFPDAALNDWLQNYLVGFEPNHKASLEIIELFSEVNKNLRLKVDQELLRF
ncbi:DUF6090 family protein [Maribacter antarcticus]|uniref:DUF6090 family protein n=1 Tax=Maribacter antarcticus TaxID=505250 RepID=UPI00068610C7|nr:DUF6090 family protein [Maribacter antarcticus]